MGGARLQQNHRASINSGVLWGDCGGEQSKVSPGCGQQCPPDPHLCPQRHPCIHIHTSPQGSASQPDLQRLYRPCTVFTCLPQPPRHWLFFPSLYHFLVLHPLSWQRYHGVIALNSGKARLLGSQGLSTAHTLGKGVYLHRASYIHPLQPAPPPWGNQMGRPFIATSTAPYSPFGTVKTMPLPCSNTFDGYNCLEHDKCQAPQSPALGSSSHALQLCTLVVGVLS